MIDDFDTGDHNWLSNFWPAKVQWDGETYPTVEHAYQAAKTFDSKEREMIRCAPGPGDAKRMGQKVALREDWEATKVSVMFMLVMQKFRIHPHLRELLLKTEDHFLVEGNTWNDYFWGVCRGRGRNNLGHILMQVRDYLRREDY